MKVLLTRQNRIDGKAGEIVEVTPARAAFLFEVKLAVPAPAPGAGKAQAKKTAAKKSGSKK